MKVVYAGLIMKNTNQPQQLYDEARSSLFIIPFVPYFSSHI